MFRFSFISLRENPGQLRRISRRRLNRNLAARTDGYPVGSPKVGNIRHSRRAFCWSHWDFTYTFVPERPPREQRPVAVWRRRRFPYLSSQQHPLHRFGYWRDIVAHPGRMAPGECGVRINISLEGAPGRAPRDSSQEPVNRFFSNIRGLATSLTASRLSQDPTNCTYSFRPRAATLLPPLMWR